jgi:DNA-binding IclR family transcriptional regulator
VGPAAFKLHTTIASLATNGGVVSATIEELAERSGLSDGTVGSALKELVDLAWLRLNATRGLGITVVLLTPPAKLAAAAQDRYMEKLKKRYNRWRKEAQRMAAVLAEDAGE